MSSGTEYLKNFESPLIVDVDGESCLKSSLILAPWILQTVLIQARDYAASAPGPHLSRRELLVPLWLNFWIALAQNNSGHLENEKLIRSYRTIPFDSVGEVVKKLTAEKKTTGVLNAAGMEGHWGHQRAVNYMATKVDVPILLLEGPGYFILHSDRRKPFLPLIVRISMWALYSGIGLISVSPPKSPDVSEDEHYQNVFLMTRASYSFAEEDDPHESDKRSRGKWKDFTQIPHFDEMGNLRTSNIVERLM